MPFGSFVFEQVPDAHTSAVQSLPSLQSAFVTQPHPPIGDPVQVPFEQTSDSVQTSSSLQDRPSLAGCASQAFVISLQMPVLH